MMKKTIILTLVLFAITIFSCKEDEPIIDTPTEPTIIAVGKGPDALFLTPDKLKLYVANVEDTTISIINITTEKVIGIINGIRYPWGFSRLATSNEVAVSAYDKQIAIINFNTNEITRQHTYNSTLGGIVTDELGQYLYVVAIDSNQVYKIDASSLNVVSTFQTGNGPDGIGISSDFNKLYVTNTVDGTISIINMTTNTSTLLNTGGKPELVHANHDNSKLFISNFNDNKVHIINTVTDLIEHEIMGLDGTEEAVLSDDKLYVVNFNAKKVYQYNGTNYSKESAEYDTGLKPIGVIVVNNKLFVTNYGDNTVSVINTK